MKKCADHEGEYPDNLNFCTKCGRELILVEEPPQISEELNNWWDKDKLISISAIVGVLVIIIALFNLISPLIFNLDVIFVIYILLGVGIALWVLGLILFYKNWLNPLSQVILIATGELIVIINCYLIDIIFRSIDTRLLFLSISVLIFTLGIYLPQFKDKGMIGVMWQLGSVYLGYVVLTLVAGSSYYSTFIYSISLLVIVLSTHFSIIRSKSIYLLYWSIPLEFFLLIQSRVINSTEIFSTSIIIILSLPITLYYFRDNLPKLEYRGYSVFEILFLFPQIALVFVISNGALLSPFPEILISLFIFFWSNYFFAMRPHNKDFTRQQSGSSISAILIFALIGFSISGQLFTSLSLIFILLMYITIREPNLDQFSVMLVFSFIGISISSYILIYSHLFNSAYILGSLIFSTLIQFIYVNRKFADFNQTNILFIYQIWIASIITIFLPSDFNLIFLIPVNLILQFSIIIIREKSISDIVNVLSIAIPLIIATDLAFNSLNQWILIVSSIIALIFFMFSNKIKDHLISSSFLLLPLMFLMTSRLNEIQIGFILSSIVIMSFYSLITNITQLDNLVVFNSLIASSIVFRNLIESKNNFSFIDIGSFTIILILIVYSLTVLFYPILNDKLSRQSKLNWSQPVYPYVLTISTWTNITIFVLRTVSVNFPKTIDVIYYLIVILLGLYSLIMVVIKDKGLSVNSLTLILSLFFISFSYSPTQYQYLGYWVLFLIIVAKNFIFKDDSNIKNWVHLGFYLIFLATSIILSDQNSFFQLSIWIIICIIILYNGRFTVFLSNNLRHERFFNATKQFMIIVILVYFSIIFKLEIINAQNIATFFSLIMINLVIWTWIDKVENLPIVNAVILSLSTIYYIQITEVSLNFLIINLLGVFLMLIRENNLLNKTKRGLVPNLNIFTLSFALIYLILVIEIGSYLLTNRIVNFVRFNQIMMGIGLFFVIISIILDRKLGTTNLSDAFVYIGPITFVFGSFVGFFTVIISNLIFSFTALLVLSISLFTKKNDLFLIALSLSILSLIKGILDWFILSNFDRSISLLAVGIQIIVYVIVFSNLTDDYFKERGIESIQEQTENKLK